MFGLEFSGHPNLIRLLMPAEYRIGVAQMDLAFADREANLKAMSRAVAASEADLFIFPELATSLPLQSVGF